MIELKWVRRSAEPTEDIVCGKRCQSGDRLGITSVVTSRLSASRKSGRARAPAFPLRCRPRPTAVRRWIPSWPLLHQTEKRDLKKGAPGQASVAHVEIILFGAGLHQFLHIDFGGELRQKLVGLAFFVERLLECLHD